LKAVQANISGLARIAGGNAYFTSKISIIRIIFRRASSIAEV